MTDDIFVKWCSVPDAGTWLPQHVHVFSHVSVIAFGAVEVWEEDIFKGAFNAPASVTISANKRHTFLTKADNTVILCIHNVSRTGEVEIAAEHNLVGE